MSTRSLGRLTLDLVARVGGFTAPMDQAARHADKRAKDIERTLKKTSAAIKGVVSALAIGATFNEVIQQTIAFENEQAQLAAVLRSTGEAAGFNQQQLNDMASSVSRASVMTTGEINQAQTTLLAFTGIVGQEFPRALQAAVDMASRTGMSVVSASETIGRALDVPSQGLASLSRQGFRFTEEQKELAKYLESTGRTAEAQGLILQALEESYGGAAQAARDTLGGALTALGNEFDTLLTSPTGVDSATNAINELTNTLSDPRIKEAFGVIVAGVFKIVEAVASALPHLVGFTTWAAEELAVISVGIAPDDIVRLEQEADEIKNILDGGIAGFGQRIRFFGPDGVVKFWTDAELKDELDKIQGSVKDYYNTQSAPSVLPDITGPAQLNEAALLAEAKAAKDAEKAQIELRKRSAAAAKSAESASKAAARAEQQRLEGIQRELTAIERAAAVWGMSADQIKLYDLAAQGATETQLEQAKATLEQIAAFDKAKEQQEAYKRLVADLRTEEERLTDQFRERIGVLDAMAASAGVSADEYQRMAQRAADALFTDAPKYGGLAPEVGGPAGELLKIDRAEEELEDWYAKQLEMLEEFRAERADLTATWDEQEQALHQEHQDRLQEIEQARQMAQMAAGEQFFGNLSSAAKVFFGENSKLYMAAFAMEKSYAIAKALINVPKSYSDAFAAVVGIPFVGPALAPAAGIAAAAAQVAQAAAIGSISMTGMAHDGIDSIPQTGTWLLEKGERVTTAGTSAKLDATLEEIRRGQQHNRYDNRQSTVNQTFNVQGQVDNRTRAQLARTAAREQRRTAERFG